MHMTSKASDDGRVDPRGGWSSTAVSSFVALIAGRWVLPILQALEDRPLRRKALRDGVGSVSDKVLTETLRRMEADKLVFRTAIASVPVEVDYALTSFARTLWPVLSQMENWALHIDDRSS
jgi:DNA-binding HxlR family transcriptional regulator